jgi:hypothetical protein
MTISVRSLGRFAGSSLLLCALHGGTPAALGAASASVGFDRAEILGAARHLPVGGTLRIGAVPLTLEGRSRFATLRLERFEVFEPAAEIVLHTATGDRRLPIPANIYLRGRIEGDEQSRVVLSVLETGEVRGLATSIGRTWMLGSAVPDGPDGPEGLLQARELDGAFELEEPGGGFRCELDDLGPGAFRAGTGDGEEDLLSLLDTPPALPLPALPPLPASVSRISEGPAGAFDHTAVIAIETDNELLARPPFGNNPVLAVDYIADLVAYASSIYVDELQTAWSLGYISLWGPGIADPWVQTSTSCGLMDFGRWWNNNRTGVQRTLTHFLSGKSTNAGVAWVGVLCRGAFTYNLGPTSTCVPPLVGVSNWGGGYGYTSGIDGNFDIGNPAVVWDIQAFTHEIGHNFNSPHTHCYENIGGNAAAVDHCYAGQCGTTGCYCDATSLPGPAGAGSGTIMSYCHLLGGGNVSLTLGLGHPYGVAPQRVPSRMRAHVLSVASATCLAQKEPLSILFLDGFFSHNTSAWSATTP